MAGNATKIRWRRYVIHRNTDVHWKKYVVYHQQCVLESLFSCFFSSCSVSNTCRFGITSWHIEIPKKRCKVLVYLRSAPKNTNENVLECIQYTCRLLRPPFYFQSLLRDAGVRNYFFHKSHANAFTLKGRRARIIKLQRTTTMPWIPVCTFLSS